LIRRACNCTAVNCEDGDACTLDSCCSIRDETVCCDNNACTEDTVVKYPLDVYSLATNRCTADSCVCISCHNNKCTADTWKKASGCKYRSCSQPKTLKSLWYNLPIGQAFETGAHSIRQSGKANFPIEFSDACTDDFSACTEDSCDKGNVNILYYC